MGFLSVVAEQLKISQPQIDHARDGIEGIAFYEIDPLVFLRLTTKVVSDIPDFLKKCESIKQYNEWGSSIHPFLLITPTGKIVGHEGRHRAASVYNEGDGDLFRIVIAASDYKGNNWKSDKWGWRWKRNLPVPKILHGEFSSAQHNVDMSKIEVIQPYEQRRLSKK